MSWPNWNQGIGMNANISMTNQSLGPFNPIGAQSLLGGGNLLGNLQNPSMGLYNQQMPLTNQFPMNQLGIPATQMTITSSPAQPAMCSNYTPQQWAVMNQQNWQQWDNWQNYNSWSTDPPPVTSIPPPLPRDAELKPPLPMEPPPGTPPPKPPPLPSSNATEQNVEMDYNNQPVIRSPIKRNQNNFSESNLNKTPAKQYGPFLPGHMQNKQYETTKNPNTNYNYEQKNKTNKESGAKNVPTPTSTLPSLMSINFSKPPPAYAQSNVNTNSAYNQITDKNKSNSKIGSKQINSRQNQPNFNINSKRPINEEADHAAKKYRSEEKMNEEEKQFDLEFDKWETEFNNWREQNANHPDKKTYKEYEDKFLACRKKLLDRREQMRAKRAAEKLKYQNIESANTNQSNTPTSDNQDKSQPDLKEQFNKSWSQPQPSALHSSPQISFLNDSSNSEFLSKSGSNSGIPGLDLVSEEKVESKSTEVIEIRDEESKQTDQSSETKQTKPDLNAISQGIKTILGDQKLLSMLSLVTKSDIKVDPVLVEQVAKVTGSNNDTKIVDSNENNNSANLNFANYNPSCLPPKISNYSNPPPGMSNTLQLPPEQNSSMKPTLSKGLRDQNFINNENNSHFNKNDNFSSPFKGPPPNLNVTNSNPNFGSRNSQQFDTLNNFPNERQNQNLSNHNNNFGKQNIGNFVNQGKSMFEAPTYQNPSKFGAQNAPNLNSSNLSAPNFQQNNTTDDRGFPNEKQTNFSSSNTLNFSRRNNQSSNFDQRNQNTPDRSLNIPDNMSKYGRQQNFNQGNQNSSNFDSQPSPSFRNQNQFNYDGGNQNQQRFGDQMQSNFGSQNVNAPSNFGSQDLRNFGRNNYDPINEFQSNFNTTNYGPTNTSNNQIGANSNFNQNQQNFGPNNRRTPDQNIRNVQPIVQNYNHMNKYARPSWDDKIITPATVVDYGHKSAKKEPEFLEPVQTFDYGHASRHLDNSQNKQPPPYRSRFGNEPVKDWDSGYGSKYGSNLIKWNKDEESFKSNRYENERNVFSNQNRYANNRNDYRSKGRDFEEFRNNKNEKQDSKDYNDDFRENMDYYNSKYEKEYEEKSNKDNENKDKSVNNSKPDLKEETTIDLTECDNLEEDDFDDFNDFKPEDDNRIEDNKLTAIKGSSDENLEEKKLDTEKVNIKETDLKNSRSDSRERTTNRDYRSSYRDSRFERSDSKYYRSDRSDYKDSRGDYNRGDYYHRSDNRNDKHSRSDRYDRDDYRSNNDSRDRFDNRDNDRYESRYNNRNQGLQSPELRNKQSISAPDNVVSSADDSANVVLIDDILLPPGREHRPPRILIIMRGVPGVGKTFLAKLIKDTEVQNGGQPPRILSLDDYFMTEKEINYVDENGRKATRFEHTYEYEPQMERSYWEQLMKSFKKTVVEGFFNFIIVDCVNNDMKYYGEMWTFAKQRNFQVYTCQLEADVEVCAKRNIHNKTEEDIKNLISKWFQTPGHHLKLEPTSLLQQSSICEVEMEDVDNLNDENVDDKTGQEEDNEDDEVTQVASKWDTADQSDDHLARLDGISKPLRHQTIEDYLGTEWESRSPETGKKRVRWADIEERRAQDKMRDIGFVVGQTDWSRMLDPTQGQSALTQTMYIERANNKRPIP